MISIFVAKLDFGITSEQLKQAFEEYGTVLKASVASDRETGKSRGFGFVEMSDKEEALNAIENLDGSMMNGRPIAVKEAEQRQDNRPPRDSNAPRTPFQRPESRSSDYVNPIDSDSEGFVAPISEGSKLEQRKKEKDKKAKDWGDTENQGKVTKMNAYKKSGKNNRFFKEDDDDDFDIKALNIYSDTEDDLSKKEDYSSDDEEDLDD